MKARGFTPLLLAVFLNTARPAAANESAALLPVFDPAGAPDPEHLRLTRQLRDELRARHFPLQDLEETRKRLIPRATTAAELKRRLELGQKLCNSGAFKDAVSALRGLSAAIEGGPPGGQGTYELWVRAHLWLALAELGTLGEQGPPSQAALSALERAFLVEPPESALLDEFREKVPPRWRESTDAALRSVSKRAHHRLTVTSPLPGATVYVDAKESGTAPLTLSLPAGSYWIRSSVGDQHSQTVVLALDRDRTLALDFSTSGPVRDRPDLSLALSAAERTAEVLRFGAQLGVDRLVVTTFAGQEKRLTGAVYDLQTGALLREGSVPVSGRMSLGELADFLASGQATAGVAVSFPRKPKTPGPVSAPPSQAAPPKAARLGPPFDLQRGDELALFPAAEPPRDLDRELLDATQRLRMELVRQGVPLQLGSAMAERLAMTPPPSLEQLDRLCASLADTFEKGQREEAAHGMSMLVDQIERLPHSPNVAALRSRALLLLARFEQSLERPALSEEAMERVLLPDAAAKPDLSRFPPQYAATFESVRARVRQRPMRAVRFTSTGPAVKLIVDGRSAGMTPATLSLRDGRHSVQGRFGELAIPVTRLDVGPGSKALVLRSKVAAAIRPTPAGLVLSRSDQPAAALAIGEWTGAAGVIAVHL